ncbi:MAG: 4Fe-4S double cluster binding domain-containing protein [Candidatus Heimdallarchaeota archaeon]
MDNENKIIRNFYKSLESKGYKGKIVSAEHLPDLSKPIQNFREQNLLDPKFYEEYKSFFEIEPDIEFPEIRSLFIISVPVPQFEAKFHWNKKEISLLIPPTYLYGLKIINEMIDLVSEILEPTGYKVAYARLPQKTLAVRSGLAEYGRNNITYIPRMGSFHRLTTLYSDFPTPEDNWQELKMMDLCKECSACTRKCPTGAIPTDRFLLRAEYCLTYHNEQPPEVSFPEWIDPSWHNCLVGCLHCQKVCPANKKVKNWTEKGPEFNEEETNRILEGIILDDLPKEAKQKIEKFDLVNYFEVLPRNLTPFIKK